MRCGIDEYVDKLTAELTKRVGSPAAAALLKQINKVDKRTVDVNGLKIGYYSVSEGGIQNLAVNTSEGIFLQKDVTAAKAIEYLNKESVDSKLRNTLEVKKKADDKLYSKYGVRLENLLKTMDNNQIRKFLLLHEHRHNMQVAQRKSRQEFMKEYKEDPVKFEYDANKFALVQLGKIDKKIAEKQAQKKEEYVVKPNKAPDMKKAVHKASKATKYIGYGKPNSSTKLYEEQLREQGMPINIGSYTKDDVVFASVNGTPSKTDFVNTLKQVVAALEAGATVLTDSESYLNTSTYNKGEQELAKYLLSKGYTRTISNGNSQVAEWKKITDEQPTNKAVTEEPALSTIENQLSTKDRLKLILDIYNSSDSTKTGGYVENVQIKDGYKVSGSDEDVKAGEFVKGYQEENLKDYLPKISKPTLNQYNKAFNAYYNEMNRTSKSVRSKIDELLKLLGSIEAEESVATVLGLKQAQANLKEDIITETALDAIPDEGC